MRRGCGLIDDDARGAGMRILLTHRFFWPDAAPYGLILKQIAEGLAKDGHEVGIFSAMPSYRSMVAVPKEELIGGVTVRRDSAVRRWPADADRPGAELPCGSRPAYLRGSYGDGPTSLRRRRFLPSWRPGPPRSPPGSWGRNSFITCRIFIPKCRPSRGAD